MFMRVLSSLIPGLSRCSTATTVNNSSTHEDVRFDKPDVRFHHRALVLDPAATPVLVRVDASRGERINIRRKHGTFVVVRHLPHTRLEVRRDPCHDWTVVPAAHLDAPPLKRLPRVPRRPVAFAVRPCRGLPDDEALLLPRVARAFEEACVVRRQPFAVHESLRDLGVLLGDPGAVVGGDSLRREAEIEERRGGVVEEIHHAAHGRHGRGHRGIGQVENGDERGFGQVGHDLAIAEAEVVAHVAEEGRGPGEERRHRGVVGDGLLEALRPQRGGLVLGEHVPEEEERLRVLVEQCVCVCGVVWSEM